MNNQLGGTGRNNGYPVEIANNYQSFQHPRISSCEFVSRLHLDPDNANPTIEDLIVPDSENEIYAYEMVRLLSEDDGLEVFEGRLCTYTEFQGDRVYRRTSTKVTVRVISTNRMMQRGSNEVAAMQYLQGRVSQNEENDDQQQSIEDRLHRVEQDIRRHHVITAIDVLIDGNIHDINAQMYIIMPFCEGFDSVLSYDTLSESEARKWFIHFLRAIKTMQESEICHKTIHMENIVVRDGLLAIVNDFGFSQTIPYVNNNGDRERCLFRPDQACVNKCFCMAPEIASREAFDGHAIDLWALGPILFMLICGSYPWDRPLLFFDQKYTLFSKGNFAQYAVGCGLELSDELMDLLQGMFWSDPRQRLSLAQVWDHPWVKKANDIQ